MSPFAASNFDSPLAATEEAVNATLAPFAPIPEAVQLQLGNVSTADAFLARRRWTSPPHQGKGRQPKWRPRLISLSTVACFV